MLRGKEPSRSKGQHVNTREGDDTAADLALGFPTPPKKTPNY